MTPETAAAPPLQVLQGREVPLGGQRALLVRRTLPHRERSFVGAWCFVDHYGPTRVRAGDDGGMDVAPHPHTGLQTVSWLFEGEIEHEDSGGATGLVVPGEINLMTSGDGIAHSEVSTAATTTLHGVQLWVALPEEHRRTARRAFEHHAPEPADLPGGAGTALVLIGSLPGVASSPVASFTPLLGAQLDLAPGADLHLEVDPAFEHGVLLDVGAVRVDGTELTFGDLACRDEGGERLHLEAGPDGARLLLIGGRPFEEDIVMWWNFVGRTHDEVVQAREDWEAASERFGSVPGYTGEPGRIPAPPIPPVRLRPRGRRGSAPTP